MSQQDSHIRSKNLIQMNNVVQELGRDKTYTRDGGNPCPFGRIRYTKSVSVHAWHKRLYSAGAEVPWSHARHISIGATTMHCEIMRDQT